MSKKSSIFHIRNYRCRPITLMTWLSFATALTSNAASRKPTLTSIFSEVNETYKREMLPTGKWKPETYAFAQGKLIDEKGDNSSLVAYSFEEIGGIIAEALAKEQYYPTPGPEDTDLLIMVHWGITIPGDTGTGLEYQEGMNEAIANINMFQEMTPGDFGGDQQLLNQFQRRAGQHGPCRLPKLWKQFRKTLTQQDCR